MRPVVILNGDTKIKNNNITKKEEAIKEINRQCKQNLEKEFPDANWLDDNKFEYDNKYYQKDENNDWYYISDIDGKVYISTTCSNVIQYYEKYMDIDTKGFYDDGYTYYQKDENGRWFYISNYSKEKCFVYNGIDEFIDHIPDDIENLKYYFKYFNTNWWKIINSNN